MTKTKAETLIGTVLSGSDFNKHFANKKFVKLTTGTENHNGFQFDTGTNVDIIKFDPTGSCSAGGFYFIEKSEINNWFHYNNVDMHWIREVTIPDDALVYVESNFNKFKTTKFLVSR